MSQLSRPRAERKPFPVLLVVSNSLWVLVVAALVIAWPRDDGRAVPAGDAAGRGVDRPVPAGDAAGARPEPGGSLLRTGSDEDGPPIGEALASALAIDDRLARLHRVSGLLMELTPFNLPDVLAAMEQANSGWMDDILFREFLSEWAAFDGPAAMAYARDEDSAKRVRWGDDTAINRWARVDPDSAIAWLETVPDGGDKQELHHNIVRALAENADLDRAADFAQANQRSRARGESIDLLAREFLERDGPEGLEKWIESIPARGGDAPESFQRYAFARATEEIARKDPDQVEAWIVDHQEAGYVDGRAYFSAAAAIAGDDPRAGVDWLMELPQKGERNEAVAWSVGRWAREDVAGASAWLSSQPLDASLDAAVGSLAREIVREDPGAAMVWGNAITSEDQRNEALVRIGREWIQRDKAAAAEWLSSNPVSDPVLEQLARMLE